METTAQLYATNDQHDVLVLVGAGASFDCDRQEQRPELDVRMPLVGDLFETNKILSAFKPVETIADDLYHEMQKDKEAESVEAYLRKLRHDGKPFEKAAVQLVPLYLQARIAYLGELWAPYSGNYARLVTQVRRHSGQVAFVSLNYDTLLDDHISEFSDIGDYVGSYGEWMLIKPHGSVNWGKRFEEEISRTHNEQNIQQVVQALGDGVDSWTEILPKIVPHYVNLREHTNRPGEPIHYPQIAIPLGASEDKLLCPHKHGEMLRHWLGDRIIHVLAIGYSGLDQEVLRFIHESNPKIASIHVVNYGETNTRDCVDVLAKALAFSNSIGTHDDGFRTFVGQPLADYLSSRH